MPKQMPPADDPIENIFAQEQAAKDTQAKESERLAAIAGVLAPHLHGLGRDKISWEQAEGRALADKDYLARLERCYVGIAGALKKFGLQTALARIDAPLSPTLDAMQKAWRQQVRMLDLAMHGDRNTIRKDLIRFHSHRQDGVAWWFFRLAEQDGFADAIWEAVKSEVTGEPTPTEREKIKHEGMRSAKAPDNKIVANRETPLHERPANALPQSREKAYRLYVWAIEQNPELANKTDRDVYAYLKIKSDDPSDLPANANTFASYLNKARKHYCTQKHVSRAGRSKGKSVVDQNQL